MSTPSIEKTDPGLALDDALEALLEQSGRVATIQRIAAWLLTKNHSHTKIQVDGVGVVEVQPNAAISEVDLR